MSSRIPKRVTFWALLAFIALSLSLLTGCDALSSLRSKTLEGDIFVRLGSGKTEPQGGVEVNLLSEEFDSLRVSLEQEYLERLSKTLTALEELKELRVARQAAFEEGFAEYLEGIDLKVGQLRDKQLYVEPTSLVVTNNTQIALTSVLYELWCGEEHFPPDEAVDVGINATILGLEKLRPGRTTRTQWRPLYWMQNTDAEARRRLVKCPAGQLIAKPVGFAGYDDEKETMISPRDVVKVEAFPSLDTLLSQQEELLSSSKVEDLDEELLPAIPRMTIQSVRSDINGHYAFPKVKRGNYVIFASYETAVEESGWLVPVKVPDITKQDLSNFNLRDPKFVARWTEALAEVND